MEALNFLKFWKTQKEINNGGRVSTSEDQFDYEGEDSFIDLELTLPDNSNDGFSKRRVIPIDQQSQSPISGLKSSPMFKVSVFKKPKSKTEEPNMLYTVNFKIPSSNSPSNSKRFSKEAIQKYLKLIKFKPLNIKVMRKTRPVVFFSDDTAVTSSSVASSPAPAVMFSPMKEKQPGFRVVGRHLKKSRSASSSATATAAVTPGRRSDDSLMLHNDGIQSAILHCKKSFNSSRDSSSLSRCTSDSSHEKMYFSSSRDSSVSTSSDYSTERSSISSTRNSNSNEERNGFITI